VPKEKLTHGSEKARNRTPQSRAQTAPKVRVLVNPNNVPVVRLDHWFPELIQILAGAEMLTEFFAALTSGVVH
jgi:hypothetical protein